jgi:hypothetical protein
MVESPFDHFLDFDWHGHSTHIKVKSAFNYDLSSQHIAILSFSISNGRSNLYTDEGSIFDAD